MKLSPHFDLNEFTASETAARRRIDNTPTPAVVENLRRLCEVLEQVRNVLGRPVVIRVCRRVQRATPPGARRNVGPEQRQGWVLSAWRFVQRP